MEQPLTPSSRNAKNQATPKHRKKSPGDALGSGKSQVPITQYFSSVGSSSDRSSPPYSPIGWSPVVKRRTCVDSPQRKKKVRTEAVKLSQKQHIVVLSSDDSSDEFTQNPRTNGKQPSPAVVPKARLNLIKRRLYPITSSPIRSGSRPRPSKKPPPKSARKLKVQGMSRVLLDSESEGEARMEPSRPVPKLLHDAVPQSPQLKCQRKPRVLSDSDSEEDLRMENTQPVPTKPQDALPQSPLVPLARRHHCPDTSSQAVVISCSDESDFELHNSKQPHSFLSQSVCGATPQSSQRFLSSQTNRSDCFKMVGPLARKPPAGTQTVLKGHSSFEKISNSASLGTKDFDAKTPISNECIANHSSVENHKELLEYHPVGPGDHTGKGPVCADTAIKTDSIDGSRNDGNDGVAHAPLTDLSSIYLHETLPYESLSVLPETIEHHRKPHLNSIPPRNVAHAEFADSSSRPAFTPPRHSVYNEETIDPVMNPEGALNLHQVDDFRSKKLVNVDCDPAASGSVFESTMPVCDQRGAIIEAIDDDEESIVQQDQSGMEIFKNDGNSLGVVPLSELLNVSHISGSDDSELPDIHSDGDVSIIDDSIGTYPEYSEALATHVASLLVESSDESSNVITPIMSSVLDASADFFSDIVSVGTGGSTAEQGLLGDDTAPLQGDSGRGPSPTGELVNIALAVAGFENVSKAKNSMDVESECADESGGHLRQSLNPEISISDTSSRSVDCHPDKESLLKPNPPSLGVNGLVAGVDETPAFRSVNCSQDVVLETDSLGHGKGEDACLTPLQLGPLPNANACTTPMQSDVLPRVISCSTPLKSDALLDANACSTPLLSDPRLGVNTNSTPLCAGSSIIEASKLMAEEPSGSTMTWVPAETKIICGSQSPSKLHVTQHMDKTLLHNPNKPLLLDTIISECQNFAEHVFSEEPLKTFVSQYSGLPRTTKAALHCCLIELLEDSDRWLKYSEPLVGSIDNLVTSGILEYLNKNDNLITKLSYLTFSEITDVLCKLGNSPSKSVEIMRNIIMNKFSSAYTCERVRKEVTDLINRKFVKLTPSASFCIKISLELFVLPLNLCDKFYKTVDVARYVNTLIRDVSSNKVFLLPLKMSKISANEHVLRDLSAICRLKSDVMGSDLNDERIYLRLNDISSSIAVLDVSGEMDASLRNCPTFKFLMTNYVHALDEQLKSFLYLNSSDIEFAACIYLGVLLKQNVTGFQHKVKWCRERMRHLSKLFDEANVFEEFSKTLKEPVTPVEFIVRSEFVSNALKIKKLGLSPEDKFYLTKRLRPISHKKTELCLVPSISCLNYYTVLTKKPKGKNFNLVRANIYQKFKTNFPWGVEDNGSLLFNGIFLIFWQAIYLNLEGVFVNKFQNCPLDWGSGDFFIRRENFIKKLASEMQKYGLPAVFKLVKRIFEQFLSHRCVVDWKLVAPNLSKIQSLIEALGMDRFVTISIYVLEKVDERILGFPDIVLWNPESKTVKVVGLRKLSDPLYPYQILWLEKLLEFGLDAEELQIVGNSAVEQCSQIK